ncbi:hypothetical protein ACFOX0_12000 [Micromonospora zhanjiangensis]|uniref:Uncharacterized protein n=1 Tax=Micromonospora zhanjiangensis TaxID=1522057 RepID=A0ABV8KL15_9ACTN
MTGTDEPVDRSSVVRAVRLTFAAHDCEPGMARQRRCDRCTDDGCAQLDWAERTWRDFGRGGQR